MTRGSGGCEYDGQPEPVVDVLVIEENVCELLGGHGGPDPSEGRDPGDLQVAEGVVRLWGVIDINNLCNKIIYKNQMVGSAYNLDDIVFLGNLIMPSGMQ